jgi:hypothetical protein
VSPGDDPTPGRPAGPPGRARRLRAGLRALGERVVLGAGTGGATTLVLAWAGLPWRTALGAGGVAAVVVVVAAWVASTVPPLPSPAPAPDARETPSTRDGTPDGAPDEPGRSGPRRPAP